MNNEAGVWPTVSVSRPRMKLNKGPESRHTVLVPRIAIQPKQLFTNGKHRPLCQWKPAIRRIRSPKRMPFEHVFYLNNFNLMLRIRIFFRIFPKFSFMYIQHRREIFNHVAVTPNLSRQSTCDITEKSGLCE